MEGTVSDSSGQVIMAKTVSNGTHNSPFDFRTSTGLDTHLAFVKSDSSGHEYLYSSKTLSLNCWYHVAVTVNNNDCNFYVDGVVTGKWGSGFTKPASGNSKPAYIGRRDNGLYFDGTIDEVQIYNRALSAEEIQSLMHTRPDADDASLVGYWDFHDGEGQVAADMSGYGNHGQLGSTPDVDTNDPAWVTSDAPVGICTLEGIVERNLSDVKNRKLSILEQLYETMLQEQALWDYMDTVFKDRDFGDTDKGDVAKAKQKIMGAVQHEEQAGAAIDRSLDKLVDAMDALGLEPVSQQ